MRIRILLLLALGAAMLAVYTTGLAEWLDPDRLASLLSDSGAWGPALFVLLFSLCQAFGVPGVLFMLTAVAVWPIEVAFLLNWAGAIGAGIVGFTFARTLGREWVARHLPDRVRRFESDLTERSVQTVAFIRLTLFLFPPAHWLLGLSPVAVRPFLLGSAIGFTPGIALWTFGGRAALTWLQEQPRLAAFALTVVVAIALVARYAWRRRAGATSV